MELLKRIYFRLPVINELRRIESGTARALKLLQHASIIRAIESLKAGNERYRSAPSAGARGAILVAKLRGRHDRGNFPPHRCAVKNVLEIGIGDGRENNTAALVAMGWSGWWIDANKKACNLIAAAPVARGARRSRPTEDPRHAKIRCEPQGIRAARRGVRLFTRRLRHHRRQCLFRAKRLVGDKFVAPFTAENHYEPQR